MGKHEENDSGGIRGSCRTGNNLPCMGVVLCRYWYSPYSVQQWAKVSGESDKGLIPLWDGGHTADEGQENKNDDSNGGFNIDIEK